MDVSLIDVAYSTHPYGSKIREIQSLIDQSDIVVLFNAHFDLHWLRRYGIQFSHKLIWDCQYAHFCLTYQETPLPSLDGTAAHYKIPGKLGFIEENYWSKGIDTPSIPRQELEEYLAQDLKVTYNVFLAQKEEINRCSCQLKRLIWNGFKDILVTEEMEWNGLKYDLEKSKLLGNEVLASIMDIDTRLNRIAPERGINWSSNDNLSAVLYGGILRLDAEEEYFAIRKDGTWVPKRHKTSFEVQLPRLVEPLERTEVKKGSYFQVNEKVLRKLKATGKAKEIIDLLLERTVLETQVERYFHGFPNLYQERDWQDSVLHGQLIHCVAGTGRLSSRDPNQQNLDKKVRECIVTRFPKQNNAPSKTSNTSATPLMSLPNSSVSTELSR